MKKQEELFRELSDMMKETKEGKLHWKVEVRTTEYNDASEKPVEQEDGMKWTIDECYVSFYCSYRGREFCMITYELIKSAEGHVVSSNMVFLPPLRMRYFDLHTLASYSVETSPVLLDQIHRLWEMLLDMYKANPERVSLKVTPGALTIEDE